MIRLICPREKHRVPHTSLSLLIPHSFSNFASSGPGPGRLSFLKLRLRLELLDRRLEGGDWFWGEASSVVSLSGRVRERFGERLRSICSDFIQGSQQLLTKVQRSWDCDCSPGRMRSALTAISQLLRRAKPLRGYPMVIPGLDC